MSTSPKAAAQARTSRARNVRWTVAASPGTISLNVLFTMVCIAAHARCSRALNQIAQARPRPYVAPAPWSYNRKIDKFEPKRRCSRLMNPGQTPRVNRPVSPL